MNYALIGCGRISPNHLTAAKNNGLNIVAVCDLLPEAMEKALSAQGLAEAGIAKYTDYRTMLREHPELELVSIATESGSHARIALDCIDRGLHVIIEKPIALSMPDAEEIIRRGKLAGVKVCACHQNRFNTAVQTLRKALEEGRFGTISHGSVQVRWHRDRDYYAQAPWRGTWKEDGGCLMNQCIHGIDLLRWMMGDQITEVYGVTRRQLHDYIECEDVGMAVVKFANGAVGTIEGTANVFRQDLDEQLCLYGERGTAILGGISANTIVLWDFADAYTEDSEDASVQERISNVYGNGHTALYADMIRAIGDHREPYVDAVAGRNALELVLAIYQSAATGQPVQLPLQNVSTMDFSGRF